MNIGALTTETLVEAAALTLSEVYPSHGQDTVAYRQAWMDGFMAAAQQVLGLNKFQFAALVMKRMGRVYFEGPHLEEARKILRLPPMTHPGEESPDSARRRNMVGIPDWMK